ncbi:MAG TPA: hypothetical protein VNO55_12705 [Polyangia bacterium]|nr:hypothetical protein [Polyangia bacterium]
MKRVVTSKAKARFIPVLLAGALLAGTRCASSTPPSSGGSGGQAGAAATGSGGAPGGGSGGAPGDGSGGATPAGTGGTTTTGSGGAAPGAGGTMGGGTVDTWPQAGGPDGTFRASVDNAPTTWSVATNKNILWQTNLDNEGQGGIAVSGELLFLTTFLPFTGSKTSLSIEGYAIDRKTGAVKWRTKPLTGNGLPSGMAYQYSDATSWTPIAEGKYVWFFNSTGHMGLWDTTGTPDAQGFLAPVWEGNFAGQNPTFPYNRQHEPFMVGTDVVILSPLGMGMGDPTNKTAGWNYLHGIDKMTGKTTWTADDASTFYNTAVMGKLPNGMPAVVHGRGGPHGVPERPVGLSLTSLAPGSAGKSLWQYTSGGPPMCTGGSATTPGMCTGGSGTALYNTAWDQKYAYWFTDPPNETVTVLDIMTGKPVHGWSLSKLVDIRRWNAAMNKYETLSNVNVNTMPDWEYSGMMHVVPDWHSNVVANGYVWFLTVTNNNDRWGTHTGPPHCVGRVNAETGKVEYLEVPVGVRRTAGMPEQLVYGMNIVTTAMDAKGNDVADDAGRSHTDGWSIPVFYPAPIVLGNKIYFGTTLGITYVIDASAKVLDETAILGYGDLGPLGQTWSLAAPAFAGGVMYHHSSKQVVAISAAGVAK